MPARGIAIREQLRRPRRPLVGTTEFCHSNADLCP